MGDDGVTPSTDPLSFLANADATDTISLDRQDFTLATLGLGGPPDLLEIDDAAAALGLVTTALETVSAGLRARSSTRKKRISFAISDSRYSSMRW
jgi:flagellin